MKIIVDGMGGDEAPLHIVDGAVLAAKEFQDKNEPHQIVITGPKEKILGRIHHCHGDALLGKYLEIVHTDEWIEMHESPVSALTKKTKSSMHLGMEMVKRGEADAFVSMGNTGAVMAVALMRLGRIEGVARPTIGAFFPSMNGRTLILDIGTNVDCKPNHLLQFALMGSVYVHAMYNIENPKVGLLSIGEEENKGDDLTVKSNELFREKKLFDFAGNVEGRDILNGTADVVICDGFVGNVVLKFGESVAGFLKSRFRSVAQKSFKNKLMMLLAKPALMGVFKDMDYQEYGGVPLLGVNGVVIIGHGSSSPKALNKAIHVAKEMVEKKINEVIREKIILS
ncbi:phosphate acyltransferase PlsX [bacterium]|nr:phosphate acyltransferase PlsX [bacterium]